MLITTGNFSSQLIQSQLPSNVRGFPFLKYTCEKDFLLGKKRSRIFSPRDKKSISYRLLYEYGAKSDELDNYQGREGFYAVSFGQNCVL